MTRPALLPPHPDCCQPRALVGVTFALGQAVSFPYAPDGLAQVDGLLRTHVEVLYARKGRLCRARVPARAMWRWQATRPLLFPADNPFGRAIVRPKSKTFTLEDAHGQENR